MIAKIDSNFDMFLFNFNYIELYRMSSFDVQNYCAYPRVCYMITFKVHDIYMRYFSQAVKQSYHASDSIFLYFKIFIIDNYFKQINMASVQDFT